MRVEFVSPYEHTTKSGIGRYLHTLARHLSESVDVAIQQPRFLPLAERVSPLLTLPIGIQDHVPGSIVHFPQIMGCAMMLYRPYHPSVATVHDLGVLEIPEEWAMHDPVARHMLRLSLGGLRKVDLIFCVSEFTRQSVIRQMGVAPERAVAIHSGVDHQTFCPIADAVDLLVEKYTNLKDCSRPWILYVGSELPRKNLVTLLEGVAMLRQEFPDLHLLKVGSPSGQGFRQQTLRTMSRLGIEDRVHFFQQVSEQDLALFYNSVDLLVQPSHVEGFGFPVIEAMACGTPVVCSRAGSLPEVAGDAAILVEARDADAFADAITAVLQDDSLRVGLKQRGLERAAMFGWVRTAEETLAVYQQLAGTESDQPKVRSSSDD